MSDKALPDSGSEWPFRFACKRSGNCCSIPGGFVRVNESDIERIAEYLGMSQTAVRSRYVRADGCTLKDSIDGGGRCVFLVDGAQAACGIYPVRPEKCATFPFWPELRLSAELLERVAARCPGMNLSEE